MPRHIYAMIQNVGSNPAVGADLRVCPDLGVCPGTGPKPATGKNVTRQRVTMDHISIGHAAGENTTTGDNAAGEHLTTGEHIGSPLPRVIQWFKTMTTRSIFT
jgi:putative transposase